MVGQIVKCGNGQGIRIPKNILLQSGMHVNDVCSITTRDNQIIIEKSFTHKTLEERASEYGGTLGPYEEFEWGESRGREAW